MTRSITVIGAGIAGLSTGCYGQMNGYQTQIFELHDKPGGLCTAWKRKGYTFDGCIHWLSGSRAGSSMHAVWQELGAVQGREIVDHDEYTRVEGPGGKAFIVYTNVDRLRQHMRELAPVDAKQIDKLCNAIQRCTALDEVSEGDTGFLGRIWASLRMVPMMLTMARYSKLSVKELSARFSDPFLREAFFAAFDLCDLPAILVPMMLSSMHNQNAGFPIGGSLEFARAIERRYLDLGGQIHYNSRVAEILVETDAGGQDRAVGVRLADGTEHRADVVVSAADGHATLFDMLKGKYVSDKVRGYYDQWPIFQPIVQVSLGIDRDLSGDPHSLSLPFPNPVAIAGQERTHMTFRHYGYDPTMAPPGKSVVTVMFISNHAYWKNLSGDAERYEAEKKDIAIKVIDRLEARFPGISNQIEVVDVATPLTYERYTGNWQGSMEGWLITSESMRLMMSDKGMDKTVPGLDRFYMVGQWVEPGGGLPPAAMSGRNAIRTICEQDGIEFSASLP